MGNHSLILSKRKRKSKKQNILTNMQFHRVIYTYVSPINAALIILFNSLQILVMWREGLQPNKYLIFNLSISDLFVGIFIQLTKVLMEYKRYEMVREVSVFFKDFAVRMSMIASILNLVTMTIIRLLAVRKPYVYRNIMTAKRLKATCVGIWIATAIATSYIYFPLR